MHYEESGVTGRVYCLDTGSVCIPPCWDIFFIYDARLPSPAEIRSLYILLSAHLLPLHPNSLYLTSCQHVWNMPTHEGCYQGCTDWKGRIYHAHLDCSSCDCLDYFTYCTLYTLICTFQSLLNEIFVYTEIAKQEILALLGFRRSVDSRSDRTSREVGFSFQPPYLPRASRPLGA